MNGTSSKTSNAECPVKLDRQVIYLRKRHCTLPWQHMLAHYRRVARCRGDFVVPCGEPSGRVVPEADSAGVRVDVSATIERGLNLGEVCRRLALDAKRFGPLQTAVSRQFARYLPAGVGTMCPISAVLRSVSSSRLSSQAWRRATRNNPPAAEP